MTKFRTFQDAKAYVAKHGRVGYAAPMDHKPGTLTASVDEHGRIVLVFHVPADDMFPAETYHRYAYDGPDNTDNHADRLRKPVTS